MERIVPAVPSGRRVNSVSFALTVYISFCTTSVVSPTDRRNKSVLSKVGIRISWKPKHFAVSRATCSTVYHLEIFSGVMSSVPCGRVILSAIDNLR